MCVVEDLPVHLEDQVTMAIKDLQKEEENADKEADQDRTDPWESLAKVVLGVWKAAVESKVYVDHQVFLDRMVDQVNRYSAPEVTVSPPSLTVNESETALLYCASRGNPRPVIGWYRNGGFLDTTRNVVHRVDGSHNLEIKNVICNDSGLYECKGSNILGKAQQTTRLVVNCKYKIVRL